MGMKMEFIDIKTAYLQADAKREVYAELPQEDWKEGVCQQTGMIGLLGELSHPVETGGEAEAE